MPTGEWSDFNEAASWAAGTPVTEEITGGLRLRDEGLRGAAQAFFIPNGDPFILPGYDPAIHTWLHVDVPPYASAWTINCHVVATRHEYLQPQTESPLEIRARLKKGSDASDWSEWLTHPAVTVDPPVGRVVTFGPVEVPSTLLGADDAYFEVEHVWLYEHAPGLWRLRKHELRNDPAALVEGIWRCGYGVVWYSAE